MAGDDWKKREACKMAAWIKPKGNHKQMVQRLLRTKAHLILCFRAEERNKIEKGPDGKTHIVPMGFQPVCSKELPYELTVSFLLLPEKPGIGDPIKLQEQHKIIFPAGKLLDESAGKAISEWASGGVAKPATEPEEPLAVGTELRTKVDGLIADEGLDAKLFKVWLLEKKKIGKKFGNPSLSSMSIAEAQKMVSKWVDVKTAYSQWIDQRNAA